MSKPANQRVDSLAILCTNCTVPRFEPVKDDALYSIGLLSFIAKGGAGYNFSGATLVDTSKLILILVADPFQSKFFKLWMLQGSPNISS